MNTTAVRTDARRASAAMVVGLVLGLGGLTACAEEESAPIQAPPSASASASGSSAAGSSGGESDGVDATSGDSSRVESVPSESGPAESAEGAGGEGGGSEPSAPGPSAPEAAPSDGSASGTSAPAESLSDSAAAAPPAESSASSPAASSEPSRMPAQIEAAPTFVAAYRGQEQVIGGTIVPTQTNEDGVIFPDEMTVGWYGPPQWGTTPGELSSHPGVLAAHVTNRGGGKDLFYNLDRLKAGDRVEISYDDGTQAVFEVDKDAVSVDKGALTGEPEHRWAWELDEPGRKVTLITCDLGSQEGFGPDVANNWVVQATRVS